MVAQTSKEETEWSHSFTHFENSIFNDIYTDTENLIFLISKSIFKKHIQHLDEGDLLKSYALKTTVFWYFEKKALSLEESDWFGDEAILLFHTQEIFKVMQSFFQKRFLPSYFIPKMNLIKSVREELLDKAIQQIERKVLTSTSLNDLFTVKELKNIQIVLNSLRNMILNFKEKYEFMKSFPSMNNKKNR